MKFWIAFFMLVLTSVASAQNNDVAEGRSPNCEKADQSCFKNQTQKRLTDLPQQIVQDRITPLANGQIGQDAARRKGKTDGAK